jgi:hypothetical protein
MTKKVSQRFAHLAALGQEMRARAESAANSEPVATAAAASIIRAGKIARGELQMSAPKPTGLAAQIVAAAAKARGNAR